MSRPKKQTQDAKKIDYGTSQQMAEIGELTLLLVKLSPEQVTVLRCVADEMIDRPDLSK